MAATADGGEGGGGGEGRTVTINVLSSLPEGEPQGSFIIQAPPTASGRDLLRLVCKAARVPLHPSYFLHTSEGIRVPMDRQLLAIGCIQEGRDLLWNTLENTKMGAGSCWNVYWFMGLLSALIACIGLTAIIIIYLRPPDNTQYGIVFDAGSSHSSMFIYKWDGDKTNLTAVASQDGEKCDSDPGGISSFAGEPSGAGQSLVKCLDEAKAHVPVSHRSKTPVYLGATAGMRLLNKENSTASDAVIESVRNTIASYPFHFPDPKKNARILTGSEEGSFSWITSNYAAGTFHVHPPSDEVYPGLMVSSMGALDMGGASTQITYIPDPSLLLPPDYQYSMRLYGSNYSLYTHSYLCYGVNQATLRLQAVMVNAANFSSNVSNPCSPTGSVVNVTHSHLFSSACVTGQDALYTFGHTILPPDDVDEDAVYYLHGEGDATACAALVSDNLFNFSAPCAFPSCSFNGVFQPPVIGDFYAFSSYYYLMDFLNLTSSDMVPYTNFTAAWQALCTKDWDEVQTMKTGVKDNLPWYCFQSIYVNAILIDGYKFDPTTTWKSIHFVEKIIGMDAGWTLGFILNESNMLASSEGSKELTVVAFALLVVLFCLFLLVALLFVGYARKQQRISRRSFSMQSSNKYGAI